MSWRAAYVAFPWKKIVAIFACLIFSHFYLCCDMHFLFLCPPEDKRHLAWPPGPRSCQSCLLPPCFAPRVHCARFVLTLLDALCVSSRPFTLMVVRIYVLVHLLSVFPPDNFRMGQRPVQRTRPRARAEGSWGSWRWRSKWSMPQMAVSALVAL